jgi:hypothetical protein
MRFVGENENLEVWTSRVLLFKQFNVAVREELYH